MNRAEKGRLLTKQIAEHKQNLEQQNRLFQQYVFQKLESHSQESGTILQNQKELKDCQKSHLGLLIQVREEISELMKEQTAMRNSQKRLQIIWIITFLIIAIPLSAFWVGWLVFWIRQ